MSKMSNVRLPEKCWIHREGTYVPQVPNMSSFPRVSVEHECVLRKNGIPYKKVKGRFGIEYLEYWDPEFYEQKEINLPLFAFISCDNSYCYTGRSYRGMIPTDATYEKAEKMSGKVNKLIEDYEREKKTIEFAQMCKSKLAGNVAVGLELSLNDNIRFGHEGILKLEGEKIQYIFFAGYKNTRYAVIFNLSKIEPESIVTMKVPRGDEGLFIGTRGYYVKRWAIELGVRRINVVS